MGVNNKTLNISFLMNDVTHFLRVGGGYREEEAERER